MGPTKGTDGQATDTHEQGHATEIRRPLARTDELIVEELEGQVLAYDRRTDEAHCLSPTAARVWRACDGRTDREQRTQLELDTDDVTQALGELEACGLLDGIRPGVTRREATVRIAKAGAAAAVATPFIYSIVAPTPAAAVSLTALCQAVNAVAGHDCGNTVGKGCGAISGCCCCHSPTKAPLNPGVCATDLSIAAHRRLAALRAAAAPAVSRTSCCSGDGSATLLGSTLVHA